MAEQKSPLEIYFDVLTQSRPDPVTKALLENLPAIAGHSRRLARIYLSRLASREILGGSAMEPLRRILLPPFVELVRSILRDPRGLIEAQTQLWQGQMALMGATAQRLLGNPVAPVIEPRRGDRRFRDAAWTESVAFDFIKQSYLLVAQYVQTVMKGGQDIDREDAARAAFYAGQVVDAMAPTNFPMINPEVLRATVESGGQNLIRGLRNLLADLERGRGSLRATVTDRSAFTVGDNIACTPGKVVYQNDLIQLIQYAPSTDTVFERPLLFVPPWINKFYVLDLQPKNSLVKWAVDQGHTVFMISWVNPDERLRHKGFESYISEGILDALSAIERATGERQVNVVAYCIGGILMGAALAHMAATRDDRVASSTMLTTLYDFTDVGEVSVFIGEREIAYLESVMEDKGYFEGERMASSFSTIRANDLVWNVLIQNYLLGRDPVPFDMLYWADDNTRMPARMHSFYLRNMYLHNRLREPGGITLLDTPLDLGKIDVPTYFLSTANDHIAPWKSTYRGSTLLGGPVKFVLGGSGHIAGVINPAGSSKYGYWTGDSLPTEPDRWLEKAQKHQGSWWPDWHTWLEPHTGARVPRRTPGDGELEPIEDAPGSYVRATID